MSASVICCRYSKQMTTLFPEKTLTVLQKKINECKLKCREGEGVRLTSNLESQNTTGTQRLGVGR